MVCRLSSFLAQTSLNVVRLCPIRVPPDQSCTSRAISSSASRMS